MGRVHISPVSEIEGKCTISVGKTGFLCHNYKCMKITLLQDCLGLALQFLIQNVKFNYEIQTSSQKSFNLNSFLFMCRTKIALTGTPGTYKWLR